MTTILYTDTNGNYYYQQETWLFGCCCLGADARVVLPTCCLQAAACGVLPGCCCTRPAGFGGAAFGNAVRLVRPLVVLAVRCCLDYLRGAAWVLLWWRCLCGVACKPALAVGCVVLPLMALLLVVLLLVALPWVVLPWVVLPLVMLP